MAFLSWVCRLQIIQWVFNNGDTSALAGAASLGGTTTTSNGGTTTSPNGRKVLAQPTTAFLQAMANSGLPILSANLTEMRPTHNATFAQQLVNVLAPPVVEAATGQQGAPVLTIALSTALGVFVFCLFLGGGSAARLPPLPLYLYPGGSVCRASWTLLSN